MTDTYPAPVVATAGSADPKAPLVVLLHGRGSNERDILGLAGALPEGAAYAAVRAPSPRAAAMPGSPTAASDGP